MFLLETAIADAANGFIYPQVEHMGDGYDWEAADSVTQWGSSGNADVPAAPNLKTFHLDPATHFTDVVTQGYLRTPGLLLSARMAQLLTRQTLPAHRSWPAEVCKQAERRDYRWLEFSEPVAPMIDWQHSEFQVKRDGGGREARRFASEAQLARFAMELVDTLAGTLLPGQIVFHADSKTWDLFMLKLSTWTVLVSDGLAQKLRSDQMTGFRLTAL
jgi:hypothetical protein